MKNTTLMRIMILAAVLLICVDTFACPGCKEAMMSPDGKPVMSLTARGFGWSIIFMLGTILSLVGLATYKVYGVIRAEEARHASKA